ncbi:DUF305 domain-containing protein [Microcella alkaliphila]|uniref:DUF305 domain-containing protein n=1 Tax=Microcella alkaliphila TaxID=279828 RepID=A0A0U5BKG0_9MICO|nr:DUF305 domain-containing protein [Microcella alkaliphila]BAU31323.1 uncharacterized protein MalAC0309_0451 [Microcella alkaliphila]
MRISRTSAAFALAAALTLTPVLAACTPAASPGGSATPTPSVDDGAPSPAPADVMFVQMMIPHHEQAIEMSEILLAKDGMPAELRELAEQIAAEQGPEIERMRSWLRDWGMPEMGDMAGGHGGHGGMDGMLSEAELDELRDAEGDEAVVLFLRQMIAHHEGAIDMARDVIDNGRHPDVRALVDDIIASQQAEIELMTEWLDR